jgi:hypothetical protein
VCLSIQERLELEKTLTHPFFKNMQSQWSQLVLWQKRLDPGLFKLNGAQIQKMTSSDDGMFYLTLYQPGKKSVLLLKIQQKEVGASFVQAKPSDSNARPNSLVQICRKYIQGGRIQSVFFSWDPIAFVVVVQPKPNDSVKEGNPFAIVLDLEGKPPRLCFCEIHKSVPQRYLDQWKGFKEAGEVFESLCEWSTDQTKTKRRLAFGTSLVGLAFLEDRSRVSLDASQQSQINLDRIDSKDMEKPTLTKGGFQMPISLIPVHVRRAIKTKRQFLERRLMRQLQDLPSESEIASLKTRALGLQQNLYLWPKNSSVWFVPSALIEEFHLPAQFVLKSGEKPGDILNEKFREIEKLERRNLELRQRVEKNRIQLNGFVEDVIQAEKEIQDLFEKWQKELVTVHTSGLDTLFFGAISNRLPETMSRLLQVLEVSWTASAHTEDKKEKVLLARLPFKNYFSSTGLFLRVGKSAVDSDSMIKMMPTNHTWVHVTSGEGSHVWVEKPKGKSVTSSQTIREAAILAIHFSHLSASQAGEVYVAQKQDILKKKELAPGKVIVRRSKTLYVKYDNQELQLVLGSLKISNRD